MASDKSGTFAGDVWQKGRAVCAVAAGLRFRPGSAGVSPAGHAVVGDCGRDARAPRRQMTWHSSTGLALLDQLSLVSTARQRRAALECGDLSPLCSLMMAQSG